MLLTSVSAFGTANNNTSLIFIFTGVFLKSDQENFNTNSPRYPLILF